MYLVMVDYGCFFQKQRPEAFHLVLLHVYAIYFTCGDLYQECEKGIHAPLDTSLLLMDVACRGAQHVHTNMVMMTCYLVGLQKCWPRKTS